MANPPLFVQAGMMPAKSMDLTARVGVWQESKKKLETVQAEELANREYLVKNFFAGATEGTHTGNLSDGYNLKATVKVNRTVDEDLYWEAYKFSKTDHPLAPVIGELLSRLFRFNVALNVGVWKQLTEEELRRMSDIVTEKPGTPGLSYEVRK